MGSGCSSGARVEEPELPELPPRPAYVAGDLVGVPNFEYTRIPPADKLFEQAVAFGMATCGLNNALAGLLLDCRMAIGLLQGGFSIALTPSPNTDVFTLELLTAHGSPVSVPDVARLVGRDLSGHLLAADAQLTACLEALTDYFARHAGGQGIRLSLAPDGALVPRQPGRPCPPVVAAFNAAMLHMRSALGSDFTVALHLHKAEAHGVGAFRARLLKPATGAAAAMATAEAYPFAASFVAAGNGTAAAAAATTAFQGVLQVGMPAHLAGWEAASLLDCARSSNGQRLHALVRAVLEANGRLASAVELAGPYADTAVALVNPRTVALSTPSPHTTTTATTTPRNPSRKHATTPRSPSNPTAPSPSRRAAVRQLLGRAVEGLNAAVHTLAGAAAGAGGPATCAALLTHVLSELREAVGAAGGDAALSVYKPSVSFSSAPDLTCAFALEPALQPAWRLAPFPDCLRPPVRHAWALLQELLAAHNAAAAQLPELRRVAAALVDGARRRAESVSADAAAARLPLAAAAAAARALGRNQAELQACCLGALDALGATCAAVAGELAEAAQLGALQCGLMSPLAWSISLASSTSAPSLDGIASTTSVPSRVSPGSLYAGPSAAAHCSPGRPSPSSGSNSQHYNHSTSVASHPADACAGASSPGPTSPAAVASRQMSRMHSMNATQHGSPKRCSSVGGSQPRPMGQHTAIAAAAAADDPHVSASVPNSPARALKDVGLACGLAPPAPSASPRLLHASRSQQQPRRQQPHAPGPLASSPSRAAACRNMSTQRGRAGGTSIGAGTSVTGSDGGGWVPVVQASSSPQHLRGSGGGGGGDGGGGGGGNGGGGGGDGGGGAAPRSPAGAGASPRLEASASLLSRARSSPERAGERGLQQSLAASRRGGGGGGAAATAGGTESLADAYARDALSHLGWAAD